MPHTGTTRVSFRTAELSVPSSKSGYDVSSGQTKLAIPSTVP